jgi:hypothetical protein
MKINWKKTLLITGVILLIIGMIDPLEGSVLIAAGSLLVTIYSYIVNDRFKRYFMIGLLLIVFGILSMFYVSARGGIGEGDLPRIWILTIVPYPVGWLMTAGLLIYKTIKKEFVF